MKRSVAECTVEAVMYVIAGLLVLAMAWIGLQFNPAWQLRKIRMEQERHNQEMERSHGDAKGLGNVHR